MERPALSPTLSAKIFKNYYYLKEELVFFCRKNQLQTTGTKEQLTSIISHYLSTGEKVTLTKSSRKKKPTSDTDIDLNSLIETDFICSEKQRAFFKREIGPTFSFNVLFQKWLKNNSGKTYREAVVAYDQILHDKKKNKTTIDKQFEYNTYVRAFFENNQTLTLPDAIQCWNYKKTLPGHNNYESDDLIVLGREGK